MRTGGSATSIIERMWFGLAVLLVIAAVVGVGQWYVTRPSKRHAIDPSRARAADEAKYGPNPSVPNHIAPP